MEDDGFNRWGSGPDPIAPREEMEKRVARAVQNARADGVAVTYQPRLRPVLEHHQLVSHCWECGEFRGHGHTCK